jgi:transposase
MNHETSILLRLESKLIVLENRVSFLEKENKELKIQNKALKAENKELKGRLKIYENSNTPSSKKRNKKQTIGPHSSPGRCEGHKGSGRPYPKPTHEQVFSNSCCPNCTSSDINLLDKQIIIQEEISKPIPVKVIKNTIFNYKCKTCNQQFEAKNDILKNSRIGINVVTEILISKYEERLPLSKIKNKLLRQYNLKISKSGILGIINRVCDNLKCLYFKLLNLVKFMKFIYADETSWRVKGQNNWLWSFSNKLISIFMLRKSRGKGPVDEILSNYNGVIISDGWKVYEKFCRIQQRCWAHLLREARDDHSHFFEGRCMIKNLENLYYAAKQASKLKSLEEREKNYNFLNYCKRNPWVLTRG